MIDGVPPRPEGTSVKLDAVTPVTDSPKVTSQTTLDAFVGVALCRLTDVTVGAVVSKVKLWSPL